MSTPDPDELVLKFERRDGRPVRVRSIATDAVTAGLDHEPVTAVDEPPRPARNAHSVDFTTVRWNGQEFSLTPKQRAVIAVLWKAHEDGTRWISGESLLEEADCIGGRVDDLFRRSAAWGNLIVRGILHGGTAGTFCLAPEVKP